MKQLNARMRNSLFWGCLFALLLSSPAVSAQQARTVTGTVLDEDGAPIVGATVAVDGTTNGAITGNGGTFAVRVMGERPVLVVSFYGYTTVRETNLNNPTITLKEDAIGLDEVVAVGYGAQKMRNITGAITSVDVREVRDLPALNMGALLKGQVPGLNISGGEARPGAGASVSIRYGSTGNYEGPLYVIDDVVYHKNAEENYGGYSGATAFNNLDPDMIESITILKDGSAAIYGATSGSGVILVRTKRGQTGDVKVSYSGTFTLNNAVDRPKLLNSYDYGVLRNTLAIPDWEKDENLSNRLTGLYQADELETMKKLNYDWYDKAWHGSYSTRHSVNISGGTNAASYFAGLAYSQQDTNLEDGLFSRWNFNAGVDSKLASHLKVSLRVSGSIENKERILNKISGTSEEVASVLQAPPFIPYSLIDENGNSHWVTRTNFSNSASGQSQFNYFSVEGRDNRYTDESNDVMVNGNIEYDFGWSRVLQGLSLKVQASTNVFGTFHQELGTKVQNLQLRQRGGSGGHLWIDGGTQLDAQYGGKLMHPDNLNVVSVNNSNRLMKDMARSTRQQYNFTASYARTFGLHSVGSTFVIERSEMQQRWLRGYKDDPVLNYTEEFNGAMGAASLDSWRGVGGSLSYVGRFNYAYNDKYLFEALLRSDASTKFAPENYWGMFWNFGAGWVISQEDWFDSSWIDYLKFRVSYAYTGNDGTASWAWLQKFGYNHDKGPVLGGNNPRSNGMKMEAAPNRDIHWDHTYKHNFGIDASFLDNRLSVGLDAYFDRRREILVSRSGIPFTVGTGGAQENYDATDRFGGEISLGWRDRIGEVGYRINVNTGWSDGRARRQSWDTNKTPSSVVKDGPLNMGTWGYDAVGIMRTQAEVDAYVAELTAAAAAATIRVRKENPDAPAIVPTYLKNTDMTKMYPGMVKYRDVRGQRIDSESWEELPNGIIDDLDKIQLAKRTIIGSANMNLGADWKGLTFQARVAASWGGYAQLPSRPSLSGLDANTNNYPAFWAGNVYQAFDVLDATGKVVAPANPNARYPNMALAGTTETSSIWHMPSFRMSLANVSFGYTLPRKWVEAASLSSVRFTLTGTNLCSFFNPYPADFVDPLNESLSAYPTLRTFSLGVNVTF